VKMKRLTLDISEDLHKAIKTRAVVEGVPMANMLRSLLEENYGNQ
jgi:predicted DNA binding CopG/RHH family protein